MKLSTHFLLMAEFGTGHIPVTELGAKYFNYEPHVAKRYAAANKYPFPCFKVGNEWKVDIDVLAAYLDGIKEKALQQWRMGK
jgi:hypothetical protein